MSLRKKLLPGGILLLYAVAVSRVPLIDYLGYEFSAAVALILPLVPGLFLLDAFGKSRGRDLAFIAVVSLACPLAVGALNALWVKNCAPGAGLEWFLLLPGVGILWVAALARFCAALFRRRLIAYLLIVAAVMVHPLLLGYFTPRIDSYNFIYGYFPGFTYDEDLTVTATLLLWRGVTLLSALWFLLAVPVFTRGREGRPPAAASPIRATAFALLTAALCAAWIFRTDLGFETTAGSLRATLGSSAETRHFRIYYDSTAVPPDEIRWIAAEHEFRYDQVSRFLGTDTGRVVESYLYPGPDAKRRLIGAGNTDIAKPWRGEIHVDMGSWRSTLRHELVHALAAEFGMPVIRANINVGLVEGLAMAAAPSFGNRTLQEYAASMIRFGIVKDPGSLIRPAGFAFESSTVSYVLMGAFCEYLIHTRGIERFKTWYGGGSPEEAYGAGADSLITLWRGSLERISVPESWKAHTEYYFRRGSIFSRECARAVANLNARGRASLAEGDHSSALSFFRSALGESWNTGSFVGIVRSMMGAGAYDDAVRTFESVSGDSLKKKSLAGYRLLLGDALLAKGEYADASAIYDTLRRLDLSPAVNQAVALRLAVADSPELRDTLGPYLAGSVADSTLVERLPEPEAGPDRAILEYLRGRIMLSRKEYDAVLRETGDLTDPFSAAELNDALDDLKGAAWLRIGEFDSARAAFSRGAGFGTGGARASLVLDRLERCDWFKKEWAKMNIRLK